MKYRDIRGRFKSGRIQRALDKTRDFLWTYAVVWPTLTIFFLIGLANLLLAIPEGSPVTYHAPQTQAAEVKVIKVNTLADKIDELKEDVLDTLKKCESGTATEDSAVINPMDGGSPSFGLYQFKIKTVQHYVQKFESRDITRLEALYIAMDGESSRALAKTVIFDEIGGLWNWKNCTEKHGLANQITLIRKLAD